MNQALKTVFVPVLRGVGFKGSMPHFRRLLPDRVDLLTIQFDRYGGGFVVEISQCGPEGVTTHWGEQIPATRVTTHDLHPDKRHRLGSPTQNVEGRWFRFDDGTQPEAVAASLCKYVDEAERWWASG